MQRFTTLRGIAAPLPLTNINTDMIIPIAFCKNPTRIGLGKGLFHTQRFDAVGKPIGTFVLNREPYSRATILIGGDNFGCGSSREQAPWALLDFGIRCVIAPDFANIFFENCANNGLLAVRLSTPDVDGLMDLVRHPKQATLTIDLPAQRIEAADGMTFSFDIDAALKNRLIKGIDSIDATLEYASDIDRYERTDQQATPWLYTRLDKARD
jgi:3-isopropylmalate/(R)-2-methylmalate dehydratase small subunit